MATRPYDLVIWGGSGFTGRLAAEYLARKYTPGGASSPKAADGGESVRWAIAGRDRRKLEEVRAEIERKHPHVAGKIDVLVGSVDDASSMRAVTSRASTVLSFAGPFARFGMPLGDDDGLLRHHGRAELHPRVRGQARRRGEARGDQARELRRVRQRAVGPRRVGGRERVER
jgi:hypothetical protein